MHHSFVCHISQDQDPAAFSESAMFAMRNATVLRYQLLPFLYTLFARAAIFNELPIRPLFMLYVDCVLHRFGPDGLVLKSNILYKSNILHILYINLLH